MTNIDLQRERQAALISSEDFAEWWAGGRDALQERRALDKLFTEDDDFTDPQHTSLMSHKELYEYTLAKACKFISKLRDWHAAKAYNKAETQQSAIASLYDFRMLLAGQLGTALFQQSFPLRLHFSMFLPTLLGQGTEEQQREWFERAWRMDGIIGTYAQTELGHGTFIRGLETRADYDMKSEEFILNTPSLSAYKWWPGGLGQTANVAIVMAQLYIKGKHYGLHPFLVRIRNAQTHLPEPGVDVGEIGPKLGLNGVNNGFLGLKDVRIPRKQMLMKNAEVRPNGRFVKGPEPLLTYGTMVFARVMIVRDVSFGLLQAATIATRYSAVRRQSPIAVDQPEPQILDHTTQQAKLFPQIAKGIFFRIAADVVWLIYQSVAKELGAGQRRNLPELHALSCCLKAYCSAEAEEAVEILRKSCGGHGYLRSSNFPEIYGAVTAACTYEGENTVLLLQTARFLVKQYVDGLKRKVLPSSVTYLRNATPPKWGKSVELKTLVRLLEYAATESVRSAFEYQKKQRKIFKSEPMVTNKAGIRLIQSATLHARAFLARNASEEAEKLRRQLKPALAEVLVQLTEIFVLDLCLASLGNILLSFPLNSRQVEQLKTRFERLLEEFRVNAVTVVDGFDFSDRVLGSTLGCYDGHVYERLLAEACQSPLNEEPVNQTFQTHLKPLMQGKL
ncbi:probable peroxisomal acyl-coenzyme A oxidase 1 [Ceratitis capitata]|uniref:probable peroxisomal acyl-coenzyme A oxidase 1 n=1 Tax=Ceratitis capitata TaxID=7213 RepID=UPI00032A3004|nr:probable peroxisomal acyl-coenzyme A oxidase 1 [Ceratitis capitata]